MLTTTELAAHLKRLTYKPGWAIRVYDGAWEGQHLVITTVVEDSYNPGQTVTLDVHSMLPPMPDAGYLDVWLQWRLARIETHESREFLRRDGRPVFDPHAEYGDRDMWPTASAGSTSP